MSGSGRVRQSRRVTSSPCWSKEDTMSLEMVRGLYDYHRWANRRLFDVTTTLGEDLASREVGRQFSFPTLTRMFGHLYGADWVWLSRWKGVSPTKLRSEERRVGKECRSRWSPYH